MISLAITMKDGSVCLPGSQNTLYCWGYDSGNGFRYPGSPIFANEGELVQLSVTNSLAETHGFSVSGTSINELIDSGQTKTFVFTAPPAGTYIYGDVLTPLGRALGLCGALLTLPTGSQNRPWTNGPAFDRQYLWFITNLDSSWNQAALNKMTVDYSKYQPNYFFINGYAYPDSISKMSSPDMHEVEALMINEKLNSTVLIRMANGSLVSSSMHQHGFHWKQLTLNQSKLVTPLVKDNILIDPGNTLDVLLTFDKVGKYMAHDHILMSLTADGVYPNGGIVMFEIA